MISSQGLTKKLKTTTKKTPKERTQTNAKQKKQHLEQPHLAHGSRHSANFSCAKQVGKPDAP